MTRSEDLTNYAFGLLPDFQAALALADLFAPRVPTGTTTGNYTKFDEQQAFIAYDAARAVGAGATRIKFGTSTGSYDAKPFALEVTIDDHELDRVGAAGVDLLRRAKTRTLVCNTCLAHANKVIAVIKAGVTAETGVGSWSGADADPIDELDAQIVAIQTASGILANNLVLDLGAWRILKNSPKVRARMPGAQRAVPSTADLAAMLVNPNINVLISPTAIASTGFGATAKTKASLLGSSAWLFFSSGTADVYDPSFAKSFSPREELFTAINTYQEARLEVLAIDWCDDPVVVSTSLVRRLTIA